MKLIGDFDGTSGYELINGLKKKPDGVHRVTIDTHSFRNANPFKREMFRHNLSELSCQYNCIFFPGENGEQLVLEKDYKISH
jgi:hypothetical protein